MPAGDENESEPKAARRDQTPRPMLSFEEYLQLREAAAAHWRSSDLVFGAIRDAEGGDTLVFIPLERALQLAAIHRAINEAKTWRQFKEMIPADHWSEAARRVPRERMDSRARRPI